MGKGYHNFMSKKFFHPTSGENIKRKWMAEQKDEFEKKKESDLLSAREAEQNILTKKIAMGDKHAIMGLSWMYEQPTIVEKKEDFGEKKFEWQRNYSAPREDYCKGSSDINDQPFGIEVRNVRCLRCHQWGHVNSDKICPMYNQTISREPTTEHFKILSMQKLGMLSNGLQLSKQAASVVPNIHIIDTSENSDEKLNPSISDFINSLSEKKAKKVTEKLQNWKNLSSKELLKALDKMKSEKTLKRKHSKKDKDSKKSKREKDHSKKSKREKRHSGRRSSS